MVFYSKEESESIKKTKKNILIIYGSSTALLLGAIIVMLIFHPLDLKPLFLSLSIILLILLVANTVFVFDFAYKKQRRKESSLKMALSSGKNEKNATFVSEGKKRIWNDIWYRTLTFADENGDEIIYMLRDDIEFGLEKERRYHINYFKNIAYEIIKLN